MEVLRDINCTKDTPVLWGKKPKSIYGKCVYIRPKVPGKMESNHEKKIYLEQIDPLETYDKIIVLLSGGKDSVGCLLHLLELGVPKEKIELWHHDIDGENSDKKMDWRVTKNYCIALAKAFGINIRFSFRQNGFWGEVYKNGCSFPVLFENDENEMQAILPQDWDRTLELRKKLAEAEQEEDEIKIFSVLEELHSIGLRWTFPAESPDLMIRYCSSKLKIDVASSVIANLESTKKNCKILMVSGERRGESTNRSTYNEIEKHRTNAEVKNKRPVHAWRPLIDYTEKDVWEVLKRNKVSPHPAYIAGWSRVSCAACIFSSPKHFKGIQELYPEMFEDIRQAEIELDFMFKNTKTRKSIDQIVEKAESCVYWGDQKAIHQLLTGNFTPEDIFVENWQYPAGAFHGSEGGPC